MFNGLSTFYNCACYPKVGAEKKNITTTARISRYRSRRKRICVVAEGFEFFAGFIKVCGQFHDCFSFSVVGI